MRDWGKQQEQLNDIAQYFIKEAQQGGLYFNEWTALSDKNKSILRTLLGYTLDYAYKTGYLFPEDQAEK